MEQKCDKKTVIRIMGAYVAWVMGSGFATGQEILQFFTIVPARKQPRSFFILKNRQTGAGTAVS